MLRLCLGQEHFLMPQLGFLMFIPYFLHNRKRRQACAHIIESGHKRLGKQQPVAAGFDGRMHRCIGSVCHGKGHAGNGHHPINSRVAKGHDAFPVNILYITVLIPLVTQAACKEEDSGEYLVENHRQSLSAKPFQQAKLMPQIQLLLHIQVIHKSRQPRTFQARQACHLI